MKKRHEEGGYEDLRREVGVGMIKDKALKLLFVQSHAATR